MIYRYDRQKLDFIKLNAKKILAVLIGSIVITSTITYQIGHYKGFNKNISELSVEAKYHLIQSIQPDTFSQERLAQMLKDLNVKFPHIVMAQAIIESGHFNSNIFRSNRNLFGMKQARARITTAKGTELNHAYYDNWRESVYDYAFFQSRYLNDLKTEAQYLKYLDDNYAEASDYDGAILRVIEQNNLREMFK